MTFLFEFVCHKGWVELFYRQIKRYSVIVLLGIVNYTTQVNNDNEVFSQTVSVNPVKMTNSNDNKITDIDKVANNYFSALRTKSIIEPPMQYDAFPELHSVPPDLEMDFSRILHKPYFVQNIEWPVQAAFTPLATSIPIPEGIFTSALSKIPFQASALYRCKVSLMLQVSGTPMHQGILVASAQPINYIHGTSGYVSGSRTILNTLMAAPHVFLNANEANAVMLEVPFYFQTKLGYCMFPTDLTTKPNFTANFARVHFYVVNPLFAPSGASAKLTVSVYAMFTALEFYAPHVEPTWVTLPTTLELEGLVEDLSSAATKSIDGVFRVAKNFAGDILDSSRTAIRHFTGLHSPNYPELTQKESIVLRQNNNPVDVATQFEKLDPFFKFDRIMRDHMFDTTIDEMDVLHMLKKPQFVGQFLVKMDDAAGVLCFSRPITPLMEAYTVSLYDASNTALAPLNCSVGSSLQRTLALMSKFWKGGLRIHIQAAMSNFHFCKLSIARNYSPNYNQMNRFPAFADVNNLMTEVVEFSGGGQVQTIELPYVSAFNQLPVTVDYEANSLQHGMFYIYLNQPLIVNGTVSPSINFNVYISVADDFNLYGYSSLALGNLNYSYTAVTAAEEIESDLELESQATVVVNTQKDLLLPVSDDRTPGDVTEHRPLLSIRDWTRRMYSAQKLSYASTNLPIGQMLTFNINRLLGSTISNIPITLFNTYFPMSNLALLRKMFFGYRGGLKFKLVITGTTIAKAYFVPPTPGGVSNTSQWQLATPLPPNGTAPGTTNLRAELVSQFNTINQSTTIPVSRCAQTVSQERANYVKTSGADINVLKNIASECILEFEIPYMSAYRFVGSGYDWNQHSSVNLPACTDLGNIVLALDPEVIDSTSGISIEIFIGMDDTARLGYQVIAPQIVIPGVNLTTGACLAIPYCRTTATGNPTANVTPTNLACYYEKGV